jgi:hypothetical protein
MTGSAVVKTKVSLFKLLAVIIGACAIKVIGLPPESMATTAPTNDYQGLVRITNSGLKLFEFVGYNDAPFADLVPTSGPIPRGDNMNITIVNYSTRAENFTILGKTTPTIRPGHKARLHVTFLRRGSYGYGSTLNKASNFHGSITVY